MLFTTLKRRDSLQQSIFNRLINNVNKRKEEGDKISRRLKKVNRKARSLPCESELEKYIGPLDDCLVKNAEIAKRRRTNTRRYSAQLEALDKQIVEEDVMLEKSNSSSKNFVSKNTPLSSVRCMWCEPLLHFQLDQANHRDDEVDELTQEETYIDENGIYTTVLCFTEIWNGILVSSWLASI